MDTLDPVGTAGFKASLPMLDALLTRAMRSTDSPLGNVQLMDWRSRRLSIAVQRGFAAEALAPFAHLEFERGYTTACMRAVLKRCAITIEDVEADAEFAPYRVLAADAGFRSVASVPMISENGALLGVVSVHDATQRTFSAASLQEITTAGAHTAQCLVRLRARLQPDPFRMKVRLR